MTDELVIPFSARNQGPLARIDNDFPESARIGLHFLLTSLVDMRYVAGWKEVRNELRRIARDTDDTADVYSLLLNLPWQKAYDFCERLYSHLAHDVDVYADGEWQSVIPKDKVQEHIIRELQTLFLEENLAFEFSKGIARRRGRRNTADKIARAESVLGDPKLSEALKHFNKALGFFRNVSQPDDQNTIKEAVCAVEAAARLLFPDKGTTLGDIVNEISGNAIGQLPKAIAKTFHGLYGFSSAGEGVRHGGGDGGPVTRELAEYSLAVSASQIVLLYDLYKALDEDIPF